jgi:hypothetical protein
LQQVMQRTVPWMVRQIVPLTARLMMQLTGR